MEIVRQPHTTKTTRSVRLRETSKSPASHESNHGESQIRFGGIFLPEFDFEFGGVRDTTDRHRLGNGHVLLIPLTESVLCQDRL